LVFYSSVLYIFML